MTISVNNGRAATIAFDGVEKRGHVLDHEGVIEAAFFGDVAELRKISAVTIDGSAHAIVGRPQKGDIKGTVRLLLQLAGD